MKTGKLLKVLIEARVWDTLAPTLNLWGIYVILTIVLFAIYGTIITALFYCFTTLLWWAQKVQVKRALKDFWYELPAYKFHGVFIVLEIGALLAILKFLIFATNTSSPKETRT